MTKRHLIALDLDGTLLTDDKVISKETIQTVRLAKEQGHIVMIATGRPYRSSEKYYHEMNLTTPIVNFNGAFVHHPKNLAWGVYHEPLALSTVKEIVETCHDFQFHNIIAEVLDDVYLHYHDEKLLDIFSMGEPTFTTGDLREFLHARPTSVLIHAQEQEVTKIQQYLSNVHAEVISHRNWGAPWHVIEIVRSGLNKAVGIQKVAESYNIAPSEIIAFGDEDNDLEMIEYAGTGVAMSNGIDSLKLIANEITETNENNGVSVFLKEYLKL